MIKPPKIGQKAEMTTKVLFRTQDRLFTEKHSSQSFSDGDESPGWESAKISFHIDHFRGPEQ